MCGMLTVHVQRMGNYSLQHQQYSDDASHKLWETSIHTPWQQNFVFIATVHEPMYIIYPRPLELLTAGVHSAPAGPMITL